MQSPGESSDRALKAHDIQANVLRTCSTKISHWLRPGSDGKSNGSKIKSVQKDNGLLKNVRSWTCKICGFQLEGQRYRDSRGKIFMRRSIKRFWPRPRSWAWLCLVFLSKILHDPFFSRRPPKDLHPLNALGVAGASLRTSKGWLPKRASGFTPDT